MDEQTNTRSRYPVTAQPCKSTETGTPVVVGHTQVAVTGEQRGKEKTEANCVFPNDSMEILIQGRLCGTCSMVDFQAKMWKQGNSP